MAQFRFTGYAKYTRQMFSVRFWRSDRQYWVVVRLHEQSQNRTPNPAVESESIMEALPLWLADC